MVGSLQRIIAWTSPRRPTFGPLDFFGPEVALFEAMIVENSVQGPIDQAPIFEESVPAVRRLSYFD